MSDPIRSISQNNYLLSNGGGGHEYSGANGVYVDNVNEVIGLDTSASNAIETVIENSGAWGGAGLPISAGPGINVALDNGTLMIGNDETVLFSSDSAVTSFSTSEPIENFEYLKIIVEVANGIKAISNVVVSNIFSSYLSIAYLGPQSISNSTDFFMWRINYSRSGNTYTINNGYFCGWNQNSITAGAANTTNRGLVYKVVGINRISGGN